LRRGTPGSVVAQRIAPGRVLRAGAAVGVSIAARR
jgi:hypothetical protein